MAVTLESALVEMLVLLDDIFPAIVSVGAAQRLFAALRNQAGILKEHFEFGRQVLRTFSSTIGNSAISDHLQIGWSIVDEHAIAEAHRFDQYRVRSPDLIGEHKRVCILLQLRIPFAINPA